MKDKRNQDELLRLTTVARLLVNLQPQNWVTLIAQVSVHEIVTLARSWLSIPKNVEVSSCTGLLGVHGEVLDQRRRECTWLPDVQAYLAAEIKKWHSL